VEILGGSRCCSLKAFAYMGEGETRNTGVKKDSELFLQCDILRRLVPGILEGKDECIEDMFVDSKFFAYMLGMASEELIDPTGTGERRVMISDAVYTGLQKGQH